MKKLAYIKYSQKEANQKIWNSLMDKYELLKEKNTLFAYTWFPLACLLFILVAIFSWISFLNLLFKDIRFTPHYLKTSIETSDMNPKEIIEYIDFQFSEYKTKLSFGNIPLIKQKQIEATFDILYNQYRLPELDEKHEEIITNFVTLQQSVGTTNQEVKTIGKDINSLFSQTEEQHSTLNTNLNELKQETSSISRYTNKKLTEEVEEEKRRVEKAEKKISRHNREKGRNLDSFESALSDKQIDVLIKYCNEISVFNIDITHDEMKAMLMCTHTKPFQTTVNKYVALLFTRFFIWELQPISEQEGICCQRSKISLYQNGKRH